MGSATEELGVIFQEFRRSHAAGRRQDRGLGLGLAIADKISRILEHPLAVTSVAGRGSLFSVRLPYGELAPRSQLSQAPKAALGENVLEGRRIWVVDNDADICEAMRVLLTRWGCRVVVADSEASLAAQVAVATAPADVLIVDYHLDRGDTGLALAERINARRQEPLPVMAITANHSVELRQRMRELGYALLHKPVKPLKLRMALSRLVTGRLSG